MNVYELRLALEQGYAERSLTREQYVHACARLETRLARGEDSASGLVDESTIAGILAGGSRRSILLGGASIALGLFLAGCSSGGKGKDIAMRWPDQEPELGKLKPVPSPLGGRTPATNVASGPAGAPRGVIPRARWASAGPKMSMSRPMNGVNQITVHHDAYTSVGLVRESAVATRIESIRRAHRQRGSEWVDIGYHYVIDPSGRVWEGRPIGIEGAHVSKTNEHNLGVCVLGNFDNQRPTSEALSAVDSFVAYQMRQHRVSMRNVRTHQEIKPTACPGRNLQRYMVETRSGRGRMANA